MQSHNRMEFEANPLSIPPIYALYTQFCETLQHIGNFDQYEIYVMRALRADTACFFALASAAYSRIILWRPTIIHIINDQSFDVGSHVCSLVNHQQH
jgi:hypothetical protein